MSGGVRNVTRSVYAENAVFFFFQAEDGIRDLTVTGVQTCALPISWGARRPVAREPRSDSRTHHARRIRRVQLVPDDVELADDRIRMGHEHAAARHGVVETDAGGARDGAEHRRRHSITELAERAEPGSLWGFRNLGVPSACDPR